MNRNCALFSEHNVVFRSIAKQMRTKHYFLFRFVKTKSHYKREVVSEQRSPLVEKRALRGAAAAVRGAADAVRGVGQEEQQMT
jgi:hypothetical protein